MKANTRKYRLILFSISLILFTLACGTIQVDLVTPTPDGANIHLADAIEPEAAEERAAEEIALDNDIENAPQAAPATDVEAETGSPPAAINAAAWVGHIVAMPEGSQDDDFVLLSPIGVGEYGIAGATPELDAEIRFLRDAQGPDEYIHLWGSFTCGVADYNGCQLLVERIQRGAGYIEEMVEGWTGTIVGSTFNSGSSLVFQLTGEVPMWYSIHASQDPIMQEWLESLRDTGAVVEVWGTLMIGVPDVNGTRIEPFRLEELEPGTVEQPPLTGGINLTEGWQTYINTRYGYQFQYPDGAVIEKIGPQGIPTEEIPEGMTADLYAEQLLKVYTDQLCIGIKYSLGYIYISAPVNAGARYSPCGRTGVGVAEIVPKTEEILVGGQLYLAQGSDIIGADETLLEHSEIMYLNLEDGTRIEFGPLPNPEATYEDYLMKTREILLRILSTYQPTVKKVIRTDAAEPGAMPGSAACEPGFLSSADEVVELLIGYLQTGNYEAIKPFTANPLAIGYWLSEGTSVPREDAFTMMTRDFFPEPGTFTYTQNMDEFPTYDGSPISGRFGPDVDVAGSLYSPGWGPDGRSGAILIIARCAENSYYWHGLLYGRFE